MPNQKYGITFPFVDSQEGFFLGLNKIPDGEVRSNLIHLILTLKGSRYFLPDFGTNLMKYIFEPMDSATKTSIDREIREAVDNFIPNLTITKIGVKTAEDIRKEEKEEINTPDLEDNSFSFVGEDQREYSMRIRIDYTSGDNVFQTRDFIIINL